MLAWIIPTIRYFYAEFNQLHVSQHASALTLTSLLSIVPLTTLSLTVMSIMPQAEGNYSVLQEYVFSHFLPSSGDAITAWIEQFVQKARQLSAIGIAFFAVTAIMLLNNIEITFNKIWYVQHRRPFFLKLLIYWAFITLGPLILTSAVFVGAEIGWSSMAIHQVSGSANFLAFTLVWLFFTLLYYFVPQFPVTWLEALFGGVCVASLLALLKSIFSYWLVWFPAYQLTYGAFAAVPLVLLWLYSSWIVIIGGALLIRVVSEIETIRNLNQPANLSGIVQVLQWLATHKEQKKAVSDRDFRLFPDISLKNWRLYFN